jgi:NAD(P)-dependent dehydrogenase (short-subunit alcohol dehydrogenase family)
LATSIDLSGKVALVTGAGRGIGLATARHLARAGAHTILTGRKQGRIDEAAAVLIGEGLSASAITLDVANYNCVSSAATAIARRYGHLDILINNAGVLGPLGPVSAVDPFEWAAAIRTNLVGPFNLCRAMRGLIPAGGVILNIGSSAADQPVEAMSAYCASKAGLELFTRSLAVECRDSGIRVIGFRPGRVDTGMHEQLREAQANVLAKIDRATLAPVERSAEAIAFLCSTATRDYDGRIVDLAELRHADGSKASL